MIEVSRVVKTFDGFTALDGLDIHVPKGTVYGLVGPNGAGKSTIIRHLAGIYRQDSGTITIDGEEVFENPAIKSRIACIPDDLWFFLQAGVYDMMKFYRGIYERFDMERYNRLREVFELDEKRPLRKFSKGMQKQAAFWLAMSMRPDVLILDEPVDGLDPVMRRQVWSIIMGDVTENGTTVLISSHNLRELEDVCDYVGIIHKGKTLLERSLAELQENIVKVQVVFEGDRKLPEEMNVLHESRSGKIRTLIVRGDTEETEARIAAMSPLFYDLVPLTLEEIFIYEMGGENYGIREIIL